MNKALTKRGFTLVELILVIGMIAIIGVATVGMLHDSYAAWKMTSARSTLLQDSQAAMEQMLRILRQAKSFNTISASTEDAGSVIFKDVDNITTQFSRDAVDNELDYGEPGDLNALTGAVSSLVFTCYDIDGAALSDPVDVSDIQSVEVNATFTDPDDSSIGFTLSGRIFCATDPVAPGLVARWKLDEVSGLTAADSAASYDGTLIQMSGNEWLGGILGGALEFDGSNDYIATDYTGVGGSHSRTVAFWVKSTSTLDHGIVAWGSNSSGEKWHIFLNPEGEPGTRGGIRTDADGGYVIGSTNLADDSWHHVASVFEEDGSPDVTDVLHYVDGVLETSSASSSQAVNTINDAEAWDVTIARKKVGIQEQYFMHFEGFVDDVRIYNIALNSEEVAVLANILSYREFTEAKTGSDITSITISTPGDTSEGDLLIAAVATDGDTSSSLAPPGDEGWTEIDIDDYSSQVTLGAWWKNADASESSSHEFSWTDDQQAYGWMMRFTGHDSSSPINNHTPSGEFGDSPTSPSAISTVNYALILRLGAFDDGDITEDSPGLSGHTAITMDETAVGGTVSGGAGYLSQSSSGSSGTSTFSLTASQEAQLLTIAITPHPNGGSQ